MKRLFLSLIRQYLFWMLVFLLLRAMFLLYNIPLLKADQVHWTDALASFWHALYLDTSTACYLLILPFLMLTIQGFFTLPFLNGVNRFYVLIVLIVNALIATAELAVYPEWKTKLNAKALVHLRHPMEVYESVSGLQFFGFLLVVIFLSIVLYYLYKRVFYLPVTYRPGSRIHSLIFFILGASILFLGIRGGARPIPITLGVSHYSYHGILNWAAVNSNYNLAVSYIETKRYDDTNPFDFYPGREAQAVVDSLLSAGRDTTVSILKHTSPNIVILLMESWSADLIESLGGEPGITPQFRELEKEGLLFTQLYASGNRSQQGLASILGGFPAIPYTTLTENPGKFQQLPSLTRTLAGCGYHTSFYFGGDLDYGNIRSYLLFNGIEEILEDKDIPDSIPRGRLGVHDEFMMDFHAHKLDQLSQPFFSVLFTLSSHSPYDQPKEHSIEWEGPEAQYVNSAFYSDYSLGRYFERLKNEDWYDSTLFIIIADHSHNTYRNWPLESFNYRRIPMMFLGGALKQEFRGKTIGRLSSNVDLPATLIRQLGIEDNIFPWSRDLLNPFTHEYTYFEINDGLGWKSPLGEFVYNTRFESYVLLEMNDEADPGARKTLIREGKSFFQVLFQTFLEL